MKNADCGECEQSGMDESQTNALSSVIYIPSFPL